jgi:hypothetical protein
MRFSELSAFQCENVFTFDPGPQIIHIRSRAFYILGEKLFYIQKTKKCHAF